VLGICKYLDLREITKKRENAYEFYGFFFSPYSLDSYIKEVVMTVFMGLNVKCIQSFDWKIS
jgi:hypothetical protein